ncbi:MAG: hypothetical protein C0392_02105 [Syntrophus sp. (in: bacteria)]|nr:hypothetical protein [Syntrophus sp. (in: bacteria)]
MHSPHGLYKILFFSFLIFTITIPLYGKDHKVQPKEFGVYIVTDKGLKRLVPNIVSDGGEMPFIESNNPPRYALKDIDHFVLYGKYNMQILTINPLLFMQASSLGKPRYIFGKDIEFVVKDRGKDLFTVKPKELLGRGYFCLWINDTAWDFIIE